MIKASDLRELWEYLKERKKWWLFPIIIFLVLLSLFIICISSMPVAPILYPLF